MSVLTVKKETGSHYGAKFTDFSTRSLIFD